MRSAYGDAPDAGSSGVRLLLDTNVVMLKENPYAAMVSDRCCSHHKQERSVHWLHHKQVPKPYRVQVGGADRYHHAAHVCCKFTSGGGITCSPAYWHMEGRAIPCSRNVSAELLAPTVAGGRAT